MAENSLAVDNVCNSACEVEGQNMLERKNTFHTLTYYLLCWKFARTASKWFKSYSLLEF